MSVSVAVDDREPAAVAAALRAHPDAESVAVRRLDAGDIATEDVGFERKTSGDYLRSALGRGGTDLEEQVRKLTVAYDHAYVLIEGTFADVEARWPGTSDASIRGSVASITARFGVPVVPCGDLDRLVDVAVRIVRKHAEPPSPRPLPVGAVAGRDEPIAKRIYGCIDGIGPETAAALHDAYPTVQALLDATEADLRTVEGIGPERARAVYAALRRPE